MAEFGLAVDAVLAHEGGYANDPRDPGGETNWGISKRTYPDLDLKSLTREQAIAIYQRDWWDGHGYSSIHNQPVATKLFDMAVNMGPTQSVRLCQRALNYLLPPPREIPVDGVLGPQTITAINTADPVLFLLALRAYHAYWYLILVEGPDQRFEVFSKTWLRRAMD